MDTPCKGKAYTANGHKLPFCAIGYRPLSLWERVRVRAVWSGESPHPSPCMHVPPRGERGQKMGQVNGQRTLDTPYPFGKIKPLSLLASLLFGPAERSLYLDRLCIRSQRSFRLYAMRGCVP